VLGRAAAHVGRQFTRSLELILRAGYLPGMDAVYRPSFS
jgi:hypothetical protein